MFDSPILIGRIVNLEMHLAHQDQIIEELNTTVTAQWKEIDLLKRQFAKLSEQVADASHNAANPSAPEPPPPHY
jgi:SlyX protein